MATTITPAAGSAPVFTQGGVGASPGYAALDVRRALGGALQEGVMTSGSYLVAQRAAGVNMSVDIAANAAPAEDGTAARVKGDAITGQGLYMVPAHTAVINEAITAAHATLPRVDRVVLEIQDNVHDGSGGNLVRTRVVDGTATSGATLDNLTGAAAVPPSCLLLADVLVAAAATSISNSAIRDRRASATERRAKSIIATSEGRTNVAYGLLATPDRVTGIVLPTDGLIAVAYQALWSESVINTARAAIFLGANQLKQAQGSGAPAVQEGGAFNRTATNRFAPLSSYPQGLHTPTNDPSSSATSAVTTGQLVGHTNNASGDEAGAGFALIFAAAGTYDISVQFKATSGTVTVKERNLWVWTLEFD